MDTKRFKNVTGVLILFFSGVLIATLFGFLPGFVRVRNFPSAAPCINNLRQIDGAKQEWALENKKSTNDSPTLDDLRVYVGSGPQGTSPRCPDGGIYVPARVGVSPRCSLGGRQHSLDYDSSNEQKLETEWEEIITISVLGLLVVLVLRAVKCSRPGTST